MAGEDIRREVPGIIDIMEEEVTPLGRLAIGEEDTMKGLQGPTVIREASKEAVRGRQTEITPRRRVLQLEVKLTKMEDLMAIEEDVIHGQVLPTHNIKVEERDMVLSPHRVLDLMVLVEGKEDTEDQEIRQLTGVEDPLLIHQRDTVVPVMQEGAKGVVNLMEEEGQMVYNWHQEHIPLGNKEDRR